MNKELADFISELLCKTEKVGLILSDEKEINYGVQLTFSKGGEHLPVNIYFSKKKGVSVVPGGKKNNPLKSLFTLILNPETDATVPFNVWAGTDESGKGDFFGPLVVSGVVLNKETYNAVKKIGVKDSKQLTDAMIVKLVPKLYQILNGACDTIILNPVKYNELYTKFSTQGKKLNELLAWMHGRVIINLAAKYSLEAVIVDKFANERVLKTSMKQLQSIKIIQRVRAESDLAVACASMLSRYHFLSRMDSLSKTFAIEFPKGANSKVKAKGREFAQRFGKERLSEVAKTHFKTYNEIEV